MKLLVLVLTSFFLLGLCSQAQELNHSQKTYLKNALREIESAEKASSVSTIEMKLRYAQKYLSGLQSVSGNVEVKKAQERYDAQVLRAKYEKSVGPLKYQTSAAEKKIKSYSDPSKAPQGILKDFATQIQKHLDVLKEAEDEKYKTICKEAEGVLAQIQNILEPGKEAPPSIPEKEPITSKPVGKDKDPDPTLPKPVEKDPVKPVTKPQAVTPEEKDAVSKLKSVFSFAKRHVEGGKKVEQSLQQGQHLSSRYYLETVEQLRKHLQMAAPYIKVLAQYPDRYPEQLAFYREMLRITQSLANSLQQAQQKEHEQNVTESLKYFEQYLAQARTELKSSAQKIGGNDPEREAKFHLERIQFAVGKAEEELARAQKQYRDHAYVKECAEKLGNLKRSIQEETPGILRIGVLKRGEKYLLGARESMARGKDKSSGFSGNSDLKSAASQYEEGISYLQGKEGEECQKLLAQIRNEKKVCEVLQVKDSCEAVFRALDQQYFNWIEANLDEARKVARDDAQLLSIIEEYEPKIFEAACRKAFELQQQKMHEDLSSWHSRFWKPILKAAGPKSKKITQTWAEKIVREQLELALKSFSKKELGAGRQLEEFGKYKKNADCLLLGDEELGKLSAHYEESFKKLQEEAQERQRQELIAIAQQERLEKEKFEKGLSAEQNAIFTEWDRKYPSQRKEEGGQTYWVYIRDEGETDAIHTYIFDPSGKIVRKETRKQGGGKVHGYSTPTTWTQIAEVKKNGKVYGYQNETTWTQIGEIKSNGKVYGYQGESTWTQIGEIRSDGKVYGYQGESTWTQIAECKDGIKVSGYRGSSTWTQIAEIRENGDVYGYKEANSWGKIAEMRIPSHEYRLALLLFFIYR